MPPKLKICGLTTLEDARFCAGAGADYLGFIQYEASPRYVAPAAARAIIDWIYGPAPVGVFVNADADAVNRTAEAAGFTMVQLHGDETPETCAAVERSVVKAFRIAEGDTVDAVRRRIAPYRAHVDHVLLDTHRAGVYGGTGEAFDWDLAAALAADDEVPPLFLAGGLGATNVVDAVRRVRPFGVDVSSSLERAPGQKDFDRLNTFFDAWRDLLDAYDDDAVTS